MNWFAARTSFAMRRKAFEYAMDLAPTRRSSRITRLIRVGDGCAFPCLVLIPCVLVGVGPVVSARAAGESDRARRRTPVVEAYERVRDSVVNISCTQKVTVERWGMGAFGDIFPMPQQFSERSVGSGCVIHADGYIATNAHVIASGAQLSVSFADGTVYPARVIGRDLDRDLAVIKIEPKTPLTPIPLGRSDDLMIGEPTIAVGNPVGLQNTVTTGVLSALHRELNVAGRTVYRDVIQTDASINPGNSGGPLLNVLGELIGINTAIRSDAQNIGFAIPVDQLREMLPGILDGEKLNKVVIGVRIAGQDPPKVAEVREGTPAHKAGVERGDTVLAVDGRRVDRVVEYLVAMLNENAGSDVALKLEREGKIIEKRVSIVPMPKPDGVKLAKERLGLTIAAAADTVAAQMQWRDHGGVIVLKVDPRGPAARIGIRPGDLLITIGPYEIREVDDVGAILADAEQGDPVDVVFRGERGREIVEGRARLYAR